jgi:putative N6-adenine-specific DNA methylase
VCGKGVAPLLATELRGLGLRPSIAHSGRVAFTATTREVYRATLCTRLANRLLVRVAAGSVPTFDALERLARQVPWDHYLEPGAVARVVAASSGSALYHTAAIASRVEAAATDATGGGDEREQPFVAVVRDDELTLWVDAGGEPLHRRGWRLATAKAPLRPTLAAALLAAVGWTGDAALVDPMCGSGTIAIEAALVARGRAPGASRPFAFQSWPSFEPGTWASVRATAAAAEGEVAVAIRASDRDAGAARAAEGNARRAGVGDAVEIETLPVSAVTPPPGPPGWILTNAPYGQRIKGGADQRDLYAAFGAVLRRHWSGWHAGLLVADPALAAHTGLRLSARLESTNGSIPVVLLAGTVP